MDALTLAYKAVKQAAKEHGRDSKQYKDAIKHQAALVIQHLMDRK